jgi:hypothetical protein
VTNLLKVLRKAIDLTLSALIFRHMRNADHLQYSQTNARHPNSAIYRQTQITTPLLSFCSSVLVSAGSR